MVNIDAVEDEIDSLSVIISAAEDWAHVYSKHPETHAKLIKQEAKLGRVLRKHFRELANDRIWKYVNWTMYHTELIKASEKRIKAYDVNVIFDEDGFSDDEDGVLLNVVHDPLLDGMGIGIAAGQAIYNRDIGLSTTNEKVLKAARDYSAKLVTGINNTTRDRIQESLQTSISLGEDQSAAADRIGNIINDPARAGVIARTEAVNSYNKGLLSFADESGATQKVWQDLGADDECADNTAEGAIDVGDSFDSGDDAPPAHPNCRCGMQLIYPSGDSADNSDNEDF